MRRLVIYIFKVSLRFLSVALVLLLVAVVSLVAVYRYYSLETISSTGADGTRVLRKFTFAGKSELKEWDEKALASNKTLYELDEVDGRTCVRAESDDSASAMYYKYPLSIEMDPFVSWEWKAAKFPDRQDPESLNSKEEFDFVAQVYVVFHSRFFLNAKALQYVWTEEIPVGTVADSPYTKNVKIVVLRSGPAMEWKHEERNISADFKEYFGIEPSKDVAAVSFMTDADSSGTTAKAYYSDIELGYLKQADNAPPPEEKSGEFEHLPEWIRPIARSGFIRKIAGDKGKE